MTPTETTTILRQFNDWRRGHHDEQPDPRKIGEAIDAAIEMIERLEAAEKERDEFKRACFGHISDNSLLRAKIAEMDKQEPVGKFIQHPSNGLWEQDGYGDNPDARPLYALPGAQGE